MAELRKPLRLGLDFLGTGLNIVNAVSHCALAIESAPGVQVVDDITASPAKYPTPLDVTNADDCLVGRIRRDLVFAEKGITFWVVGDQVRKGAALNAVQIAELL